MHRHHFELIAQVLAYNFARHEAGVGLHSPLQLHRAFAEALAETNPFFDCERFLKACRAQPKKANEATPLEAFKLAIKVMQDNEIDTAMVGEFEIFTSAVAEANSALPKTLETLNKQRARAGFPPIQSPRGSQCDY